MYLVDYGLAYRYAPESVLKEYKEDPKRCHDGTIEFTSIDAHKGVCRSKFLLSVDQEAHWSSYLTQILTPGCGMDGHTSGTSRTSFKLCVSLRAVWGFYENILI